MRHWRRFVVALYVLLGTAGAALAGPDWTDRPKDISLDGPRVDSLFDSTAILVTICFVIMVGIMAAAVMFHRGKKGERAQYDLGIGKRNIMVAAAISASIFIIVDGNLLVNSYIDANDAFWNFPKGEKVLRVEVMAQQWAWNFRYAGEDKKFNTPDDIITLNELHIPTDTPVYFNLRSKDVIHSFFLPNFRYKQDAIPGETTHMWVQAKEGGTFEIVCAELCGWAHYKMKGTIHVHDKAGYEEWRSRAAEYAERSFDKDDKEAHWGWTWESR